MHQGLELSTRSPSSGNFLIWEGLNKPKSVGDVAGQEQRITSIKCAVSRKLFRDGLTKELSSL